jgi:hypothetical protein
MWRYSIHPLIGVPEKQELFREDMEDAEGEGTEKDKPKPKTRKKEPERLRLVHNIDRRAERCHQEEQMRFVSKQYWMTFWWTT